MQGERPPQSFLGGVGECGGKAKRKAFWIWVCACVCISAGLTARSCLELGCSVSLRHSMDSPGVQVLGESENPSSPLLKVPVNLTCSKKC